MSDAFDFSVSPFDRLTPEQRQRLAAALDLGVYARDGVILSRDEPADCLFVVRQGLVHERRGGEVVAVHGAHDSFDLQALFSDGQARSFVAAEDTLCDLVPRPILLELAHENAAFGAVIQQEFADRLSALANERSNRETAALTMARIRQAYLHPPVFVAAGASLRDAAAAMKREQASSVLVRDGDPKRGGASAS